MQYLKVFLAILNGENCLLFQYFVMSHNRGEQVDGVRSSPFHALLWAGLFRIQIWIPILNAFRHGLGWLAASRPLIIGAKVQ